jgi:hypothetical protein
VLTLADAGGVVPFPLRLRRLLKVAGRSLGLKVIDVRQVAQQTNEFGIPRSSHGAGTGEPAEPVGKTATGTQRAGPFPCGRTPAAAGRIAGAGNGRTVPARRRATLTILNPLAAASAAGAMNVFSQPTKDALARREAEAQQQATEWAIVRDLGKALNVELGEARTPMSGTTINRVRAVLKEEADRQKRLAEAPRDNPPAADRRPLSEVMRYF